MRRGGRLDVQEHIRNARSCSLVYSKVVGGSETAEVPNWCDYALRGRRELCVHDGALRVGVSDASESYGHARHARRVCYTDVKVSG